MNSEDFAQIKKDTEDALYLLRGAEWKQYVYFLKQRQAKLQEKVNLYVEKGDLVNAQISLGIMRDAIRQADLFRQYALENKDRINKQGESKNG